MLRDDHKLNEKITTEFQSTCEINKLSEKNRKIE